VARCLEKAAADRLQSAQEVLVELKVLRREWESGALPASARDTSRAPATGAAADLRVAVLPFTSRGGGEAEALADGLTDDITAGLSRFQHLQVVSRVDAEKAKGQTPDRRIAAALGTRYLIEGTVRVAERLARLSVRLVDASANTHMWADTYERTLGERGLFAVQDDITAHVVAQVADKGGILVRSMGATLKARAVDGLTIDELVLRFYAYEAQLNPEEHALLRAGFEAALGTDRLHASAWGCLAALYDQELSLGFNPKGGTAERQRQAAERSIELDPTCADGWRAMAAAAFFVDRDVAALRVAAERVATANRLDVHALAYVGTLLAYAGDWDRGLDLMRRGMSLNPTHPGWYHFPTVFFHYSRREYDAALSTAKRINMPAYFGSHLNTAAVAGQLGRREEVASCLKNLERIAPALLDIGRARHYWKTWFWSADLADHLVDGFRKAKALVETPAAPIGMMRSGYLGGATFAREAGPAASGAHPSIAVMPFADLSAAKDQEWFCDGIAEEILNALTPLENLRVAARASAFSLRGKSDDLETIGEKLNVTTVLGGSVRRAGDRVRITVQLSEVQSGSQLWSERYDRDLKDIFEVQDEIAKAVAERLKVTLTDTPLDRLARLVEQGTTNVEAYQLYLQARSLLARRGAGIPRALGLFQEAVALDPKYALAWAGIAQAHIVQAYFGLVRGSDSKGQALAAATRSIELDPSSAAGHTALACALLLYENDLPRARVEFERALELNPRDVQGRCWYALFYLQWVRGAFEQGLQHAQRALADDPLSAYATMIVAACLAGTRRFDRAIDTGRLAVERDPESFVAHWLLGTVLVQAGRSDEAIATLTTARALSANGWLAIGSLASAYAGAGRTADADAIRVEMESIALLQYVPKALLALTANAAGRRDEAIAFARTAWHEREPSFILFARHFPEYAPLRSDPRFAAILEEMNHEGDEGSAL
jgi:TolB-like protein/Flp pilus assembly protein TadD